jgi:predicted metal-dependent phosphoesterase TrpH
MISLLVVNAGCGWYPIVMLRGDLHHHINTDPVDGSFVRHSAGELIDRAAAIGLNFLAITCHKSVPYDEDAVRYAKERGILLLRGMEASVDGRHVLLLNFREFPSGVCSMADIAACKTPEAMVIAPHPFYPVGIAGGDLLSSHQGLFDAIEFSGLYTPLTQRFNRRALEHARVAGLPVVGNSDTHFLWQMGRTYTCINAAPEAAAVLDAIRCGRVQLVTRPLSWVELVRFVANSEPMVHGLRQGLLYMLQVLRRTRLQGQAAYPAMAVPTPARGAAGFRDQRRQRRGGAVNRPSRDRERPD